jgi:flavodoxin
MVLLGKKILIVYFSHADENWFGGALKTLKEGNTAVVAKKIQALVGGDLYEVKRAKPYPVKYGPCTAEAKKELQAKAFPKLSSQPIDLQPYEVIILGYPCWWGTCPRPLFTFFRDHDWTNKVVYPFCTNEGSGLGHSMVDLRLALKGAEIKAGLPITGSAASRCDDQIYFWLK